MKKIPFEDTFLGLTDTEDSIGHAMAGLIHEASIQAIEHLILNTINYNKRHLLYNERHLWLGDIYFEWKHLF